MEIETPVVEQQVETQQTPEQVEQPQAGYYEQAAREQGWVPKEDYQGDPEKWRDAKEFVERGELFGKIDSMGKELKETRKALKMLQEHHSKVKETEYKRAVDELKALQKKHLEEGNSDGYLEATELLTDLKAEQKAREVVEATTPKQTGQDPRFTEWVGQNKWYNQDQELREFADVIGLGYAQQHPGIDPAEVLKYVSTQVKSKFKDKFQNPNRSKPNSVEGASTPRAGKESFQMSEDERKVMNTFIRTGIMTKEAYIEELKKMRG